MIDNQGDRGLTSRELAASSVPAMRNPVLFSLGLVTVILVGFASYWLSRLLSTMLNISLEAVIIALILSMVLKNWLPYIFRYPKTAKKHPDNTVDPAIRQLISGAQFATKILVPGAIILYGANLDISRLENLPGQMILITLTGMALYYLIILGLNSYLWKMPRRLNELIATGSAICGASAIIVISPSIDAEPEETSASLLAIIAAGLLAMMVYPILRSTLGLSDELYAFLSGATLHTTGLVRAAITQHPALDQSTAVYALSVKTFRILMLAPVAIISGFLHLWLKSKSESPGDKSLEKDPQGSVPIFTQPGIESSSATPHRPIWISLISHLWFLIPFIAMGLLTSFVPAVRTFMADLKTFESIVLSSALASIGFTIDIESVILSGIKPVLAAVFAWLCVLMFFLLTAPAFIV